MRKQNTSPQTKIPTKTSLTAKGGERNNKTVDTQTSETQTAKVHIKRYEGSDTSELSMYYLYGINQHAKTCKRWMEFLEKTNKRKDNNDWLWLRCNNKILDLKLAINIYKKTGIIE